MSPDLDKYRDRLAESDMTKEEQDAFLLAVWRIMEVHADIVFGISPTRAAQQSRCGKGDKKRPNSALRAPDVVYCEDQIFLDHIQSAAVSKNDSAAGEPES